MRELGEVVRVKTAEGESLGIVVSQEEGDGYGIHVFDPNHYASEGVHFGGILGKPEKRAEDKDEKKDADPAEEKDEKKDTDPAPSDSMTHAELDKIARDTKAQNYPLKGDKKAKAASLRGTS